VPPNAWATARVPAARAADVTERGAPLASVPGVAIAGGGGVTPAGAGAGVEVRLAPGLYRFSVRDPSLVE
jgi:hypothetical protein